VGEAARSIVLGRGLIDFLFSFFSTSGIFVVVVDAGDAVGVEVGLRRELSWSWRTPSFRGGVVVVVETLRTFLVDGGIFEYELPMRIINMSNIGVVIVKRFFAAFIVLFWIFDCSRFLYCW